MARAAELDGIELEGNDSIRVNKLSKISKPSGEGICMEQGPSEIPGEENHACTTICIMGVEAKSRS